MDALLRRHGGMAMGATTTMDMGASTTAMAMASATSSGMSHDMGSMDGMSMHMFFTNDYKNYPVLFSTLKADSSAKAFGIFVLLFLIGVLTRGMDFLKNYLEQKVWKNPSFYKPSPDAHRVNYIARNSKDSSSEEFETTHEAPPNIGYSKSVPAALVRNFIRLVLCFVPEMFGFALMLAVMTYSTVYFFAVVSGLAFGRFIFERLSDRMALKPTTSGFHC